MKVKIFQLIYMLLPEIFVTFHETVYFVPLVLILTDNGVPWNYTVFYAHSEISAIYLLCGLACTWLTFNKNALLESQLTASATVGVVET